MSIADVLQARPTLENGRSSMADVYGDSEARQELHRQKELMQSPPYNTPPEKLVRALALVNAGHVTIAGDTITVKDSQSKTGLYTIVEHRCDCKAATGGGTREATQYNCKHSVAAELHQRTQQALLGLAAPSLFALPPSVQQDMAVHLHSCPTCGREWECRVLCGMISLAKTCPRCLDADETLLIDIPPAETAAETRAREGWRDPQPVPSQPVEAPGSPQEPLMPVDVAEDIPEPHTPLAAPEGQETPMETTTQDTAVPLSSEDIQGYRREIMTQLYALGCTPKTKQECEEAVMTFAGVVLAPENFPLIAERLRTVLTDRAAAPKPRKSLKAQIVQVHGQPHIKFSGLLDEAHHAGLESLTATFISVTESLALATATAKFKDGRCFTESADATPANVTPHIKLHFARMALTRAKARALRDALNIDALAEEELGE